MTDWDDQWRNGETPWDKGEAAPPLLEALDHEDDGAFLKSARVLVPGCGSGHDVRALAEAGAQVTGLDLSSAAVDVAREIPAVAGEQYEAGNLFSWEGGPFDAVWEHTCFCAIEQGNRKDYAAAMARLIRPGGRLIGVFYLNPAEQSENGEGPPHGSSEDEIVKHLEPWFSLMRGKVPENAFPTRVGREWLASFVRCSDGS